MRVLRGVGRFAYDFVIGDDWRIAAAVVSALLVGALLLVADVPPGVTAVVTALLLGTAFTAAMVIGVRRGLRR